MANVISVNENSFFEEVLSHDGPVLVDFYTDNCGPCRQMAPVQDGLAEELSDLKVTKVNAIDNYNLALEYKISKVPSLILFKNGSVKKERTGVMPPAQLKQWVTGG